jgi:Tfp pilus assembly protein FimT
LGIIIFISLISIPTFIGFQKSSKLKNQARVMATDLRLAQQYAISEQIVYNFKLIPGASSNSYQIIKTSDNSVIKTVTLDQEVRINQVSGLTDNTVQFIDTGGVVSAGVIYLANTRNQTSTLDIKPSGYVKITE